MKTKELIRVVALLGGDDSSSSRTLIHSAIDALATSDEQGVFSLREAAEWQHYSSDRDQFARTNDMAWFVDVAKHRGWLTQKTPYDTETYGTYQWNPDFLKVEES